MKQGLAEIELSLRVLDALIRGRQPDTADVEALREVAPIEARAYPPDELAREVIERAVGHRQKARSAAAKKAG